MARLATKRATSYELCCIKCGATVLAPNGSTFWTLEEMDIAEPRIVKCGDCGADVKVPRG